MGRAGKSVPKKFHVTNGLLTVLGMFPLTFKSTLKLLLIRATGELNVCYYQSEMPSTHFGPSFLLKLHGTIKDANADFVPLLKDTGTLICCAQLYCVLQILSFSTH